MKPGCGALHLEQVDAPARLYDALDVYRAHERFPDLAGPALEQQLADSVAEHGSSLLARAFPGLSRRQLVELMAQCSGVEREQLLERQRMPLALAERARWQLRERRLDRACAGLYLPRAVNADSERIAFGVLGERLAWPPTLRLELRERTARGRCWPVPAVRAPSRCNTSSGAATVTAVHDRRVPTACSGHC